MAEPDSTIDIESTGSNGPDGGDTTGDGGSSTNPIDPTTYTTREPGKRGRHPNNCECDKCVSKRGTGISGQKQQGTTSSKSRSTQEKGLDIDSFAKQIQFGHGAIGILTKAPEIWNINEEQSKQMALAIKDLAAQYNFKPDPKTMAWIKLTGVLSVVYVPKIVMVTNRRKVARQEAEARGGSPIPKSPVKMTPANDSGVVGPIPTGIAPIDTGKPVGTPTGTMNYG